MIANRFRAFYESAPARSLIVAHRGDSCRAPENTLEAATLAHGSGADAWELDVRLTGDGVPVVIHDSSLLRTTDVARKFAGDPRARDGYRVADFAWDEIRTLDAGSWFLGPEGGARSAAGFGSLDRIDEASRQHLRSGSVRVPRLDEALDLTRRLDWMVNVEIKADVDDPGLALESALGSIRATGTADRVAISSFDRAIVERAGRLEPGVALGMLVEAPPAGPISAFLGELGADALHLSIEGFARLASGPLAEKAPAFDAPVLVYTVNDAGPSGWAGHLAGAGVIGLFTDDPASWISRGPLTPSSRRTRSR